MKFTYLNCEFFRLNDRSVQGLSPVENEKSCLIKLMTGISPNTMGFHGSKRSHGLEISR